MSLTEAEIRWDGYCMRACLQFNTTMPDGKLREPPDFLCLCGYHRDGDEPRMTEELRQYMVRMARQLIAQDKMLLDLAEQGWTEQGAALMNVTPTPPMPGASVSEDVQFQAMVIRLFAAYKNLLANDHTHQDLSRLSMGYQINEFSATVRQVLSRIDNLRINE